MADVLELDADTATAPYAGTGDDVSTLASPPRPDSPEVVKVRSLMSQRDLREACDDDAVLAREVQPTLLDRMTTAYPKGSGLAVPSLPEGGASVVGFGAAALMRLVAQMCLRLEAVQGDVTNPPWLKDTMRKLRKLDELDRGFSALTEVVGELLAVCAGPAMMMGGGGGDGKGDTPIERAAAALEAIKKGGAALAGVGAGAGGGESPAGKAKGAGGGGGGGGARTLGRFDARRLKAGGGGGARRRLLGFGATTGGSRSAAAAS